VALFDLRPKTSRNDLFDRDKELEELRRAVEKKYPIIALLGIRRIGKTSILKTFLNGAGGIYLDLRGVYKIVELQERITDSINASIGTFRKILEGIRGISFAGFSVEIRWRGSDSISLTGLLNEINRKTRSFILAFDELQATKPPVSAELRDLLAYAYDNLENVTFIVAGSEIGLLRDFLGLEKPNSPLYGRYVYEIYVERLTKEESKEFLMEGFKEEGLIPPSNVIEDAVDYFDGIIGWLAFFGRRYVDGLRNLKDLKETAVNLALEELNKLNTREKLVLKAVALGSRSWAEVRRYIEEKEGITLPKATLTRLIEKLEKLSIIKDYEFLDSIYKEASSKLIIK
jgi:AAA+ ATPase superfamily predicted ATPase